MSRYIILFLLVIVSLSFSAEKEKERQQAWSDITSGDVMSWSRLNTEASGRFESLAVVSGRNEDVVYAVVKRTIDGKDERYIEQFTPLDWGEDSNDCWFVDCGGFGGRLYVPSTPEIPEVLSDYPILRPTTAQADPGLTHTIPISDVTDLQNMKNDLDGNYYLTGDIDASATSGWNGGAGFAPVINFVGTLDGCGYTVSNLYINRNSTRQGLFRNLQPPAKIANLTLENVYIKAGYYWCGALAAYVESSEVGDILIQNCHSSGTITSFDFMGFYGGLLGDVHRKGGDSSGTTYIYDCSSSVNINWPNTNDDYGNKGGLIGTGNNMVVSNCFATGNLTGDTTTAQGHGGLIGTVSSSDFSYCYATGSVEGADRFSGGFVGHIGQSTNFSKCYATGNASGNQEVGGFGGHSSGEWGLVTYTDCYAWGNATALGVGVAGGFMGASDDPENHYTNCYSIGSAVGAANVGGFIGQAYSSLIATSCFWDVEASGNPTTSQDKGEGHITTWMKTKPNYEDAGWDFDTIWYMADYVPPNPGQEEQWIEPAEDYDHLEGETLCIFADGRPLGEFPVENGLLVGIDPNDYTHFLAGLNYYSIYETFPLVERAEEETSAGMMASIKNVSLDFYETLGCHIGVDRPNSSDLKFSQDNFATTVNVYSGFKNAPFLRGTSREPTMYLWEFSPVPMTIRALYPTVEITIGD